MDAVHVRMQCTKEDKKRREQRIGRFRFAKRRQIKHMCVALGSLDADLRTFFRHRRQVKCLCI